MLQFWRNEKCLLYGHMGDKDYFVKFQLEDTDKQTP